MLIISGKLHSLQLFNSSDTLRNAHSNKANKSIYLA